MAVNTEPTTLTLSEFDQNRKLVHRVRLEVIKEIGQDC